MDITKRVTDWTVGLYRPCPALSFRIWFTISTNAMISTQDLRRNPTGVSAKTVDELKRKAMRLFFASLKQTHREREVEVEASDSQLVRIKDGTTIMDDGYLRQLSMYDDLALLLPGQTWSGENANQLTSSHSSVKRDDTRDSSVCDAQGKTPAAQIGLGIYRNDHNEPTSVRFTVARGGRNGVKICYEFELQNIKSVIYSTARWSTVLLAWFGKLLIGAAEFLSNKLPN